MSKTIEDIMNAYAESRGWNSIGNMLEEVCVTKSSIENIAKAYANQKLEEAAELSLEMMYELKSEAKTDSLNLRKFQICYAVPKQSILNLREEA